MANLQLVIIVDGGIVREVFCSQPEIEVLLVDWDVEPSDADHPAVVQIPSDSRRPQYAYVASLAVQASDAILGTKVAAAIDAAEHALC